MKDGMLVVARQQIGHKLHMRVLRCLEYDVNGGSELTSYMLHKYLVVLEHTIIKYALIPWVLQSLYLSVLDL